MVRNVRVSRYLPVEIWSWKGVSWKEGVGKLGETTWMFLVWDGTVRRTVSGRVRHVHGRCGRLESRSLGYNVVFLVLLYTKTIMMMIMVPSASPAEKCVMCGGLPADTSRDIVQNNRLYSYIWWACRRYVNIVYSALNCGCKLPNFVLRYALLSKEVAIWSQSCILFVEVWYYTGQFKCFSP